MAVTVVSNLAIAAVFLQINEILGAQEEAALARISWIVSPIYLLGGATAGVTGAFARPLGMLSHTAARYVLQARKLRVVYDSDPVMPVGIESAGVSSVSDTE